MKKLSIALFLMSFFLSFEAMTQGGFTDAFEDSSMQLPGRFRNAPPYMIWSTLSPLTYTLTEAGGVLRIEYSKVGGTGAFDSFTLRPPFSVNVSRNPHIQMRMKSSLSTRLTLRLTYSQKPPTYEEVRQEIPGDNQWHTYTFKLYDYLYERFGVQQVDFYLDQGINKTAKGRVELDDVKIGWRLIQADSLQATATGTQIHLSWTSTDPENTANYRIHRDLEPRFQVTEKNFIGVSVAPEYTDINLDTYIPYYYRIIPVDTSGTACLPSADIRAETFEVGASPSIQVKNVNATTVKTYEKFELDLALDHVGIHNPYDPDDIDVFAKFVSPKGDTTRINGFYDNYLDADTWKLRFSPALAGIWSYEVFVRDAGGMGKTKSATFTAVKSDHHGWIRPAIQNPHYFSHDDGTSWYAVGVYSPWRNNAERFQTFAEHKANLFAIWDIGYGGFVNETGIIEEELGKYNQAKLGRIDSLLVILEKDDIQLMYAIWPHDLFSENVWATEWDKNPYRELTDVVDVYRDELAWEYQTKKYRYLIARFAHSRSMGIWELINEMNGTDGWKETRFESAYNWVERADKFFNENDPYRHPTTASFSGGFDEYRKPLYLRNDIPNLHVYPAQGWALQYPDDTLRSDMYNYAWASRRFWNDFEKPAIFGEAGADLSYFHRKDPRYHEAYHNAIWASLSNGLAGIPVWWQFHHLSEQDWDHLSYLSDFVKGIDFANTAYAPAIIHSERADAFGLLAETSGWGWLRSFTHTNVSNTPFTIEGFNSGKYQVSWIDTWSGQEVKREKVAAKKGILSLTVPELTTPHRDIAFKIGKNK